MRPMIGGCAAELFRDPGGGTRVLDGDDFRRNFFRGRAPLPICEVELSDSLNSLPSASEAPSSLSPSAWISPPAV